MYHCISKKFLPLGWSEPRTKLRVKVKPGQLSNRNCPFWLQEREENRRRGGRWTNGFKIENLTPEAGKETWKSRSEGKTGRRQLAGWGGRRRLRRNCGMGERRETPSEAPLRLHGSETEVCLKGSDGLHKVLSREAGSDWPRRQGRRAQIRGRTERWTWGVEAAWLSEEGQRGRMLHSDREAVGHPAKVCAWERERKMFPEP